MKEVLEVVVDVLMFAFVAGSMITSGLGLTIPQIIEPFKNKKMVMLSLIANFILVPLFAFGIVRILPVSEGVRIGIILLAVSGGAPFIPKIVETAKGRVGGAVGLMLLLLIVTIILMPLVVPLIFHGASISSWNIAKTLIYSMLIPLFIALFVKARFSDIAIRIQPFFAKLTNITVLVLFLAIVYLNIEVIASNVSALPVILIFFLGSFGIGYLTGGKSRNARIILSVGTGLRNPTVAILVAGQYFSSEPMAAITPLLVIILGLSIMIPLATRIGKKTVL